MKEESKSHMINSLLTSFVRSVGESIAASFFRDIVSFLVTRFVQNPQANTSRTELTLG